MQCHVHYRRCIRKAGLMRRVAQLLLFCLVAACKDEITDEAGFGTVVVHMQTNLAGSRAGIETYIIRGNQSTERRVTTDEIGNAVFENVPVASWDVGYFE